MAVTSQLFATPAATAQAHPVHHPKPVPHGLQEFTSSGTFTPPNGVTSVYVQAWGGGGGGGGGGAGGSAASNPGAPDGGAGGNGGAGGSGGFTWCAIKVKPGAHYTATVAPIAPAGVGGTATAGAGHPGNAGGDGGTTSLAAPNSTVLLSATGGSHGEGGGGGQPDGRPGATGLSGTGGTATCITGGITRNGNPGNGIQGGAPVSGIVSLPANNSAGGNGGIGGAGGTPGVNGGMGHPGSGGFFGGSGYLVVWW